MIPLILAAVALVLTVPAAALALVAWGRSCRARGALAVIVVPGARVNPDGAPSGALRRRIDAAASLWQDHPHARIATSGFRGEARCVVRELVALGVPPGLLVADPDARSTAENASHLRTILGDTPICVVTDDFHAWRSARLFRAHFSSVQVHAARSTGMPWRSALREVFSALLHLVTHRASGPRR